MARVDQSGLKGATRDRPISAPLEELLQKAASVAGIDVVYVISGGQPGSSGRSIGSTRHNGGRAADIELIVNGRRLEFSDEDGGDLVENFVTAAAALGATGIGAAVSYMGPRRLHVGFGQTVSDHTKLVWGAKGKSANAPEWLREAAKKGWDDPQGALKAIAANAHEHAEDPEHEQDHDHHAPHVPAHERPRAPGHSGPAPSGIRLPDFSKVFPNANAAVLTALREQGAVQLARYGILKSERRFAYFLAQVAHESMGLSALVEKLNYRAEQIVKVFGKYIPTLAAAQAYAGNGVALANRVYGGRMGNGPESSGDGFRYRGRGLIQLTGRDNYRNVGRIVGLPLEDNPDLASDPEHVWELAAGYWKWRKLNAHCDSGDFRALTKAINGGFNGMSERETLLGRVSRVLQQSGFVPISEDAVAQPSDRIDDMEDGMGPGSADELAMGSRNYRVGALQKRLNELGYYVGKEDSIFGKLTQQGLLAFQAEHGLTPSGKFDAATRATIDTAVRRTMEGPRPSTDEAGLISRSNIVYDSSWTRLLGKVSAALGGLGMLNSGVMNSVAPTASPDALARAKQIAEAAQKFNPADSATVQPLLDLAQKALEHAAPQTAALSNNVFELLAKNAGGGNVTWIADLLGKFAGTLLPGAGGSLVTMGIGIASWMISNRVISRRIADHRAGKHLGL